MKKVRLNLLAGNEIPQCQTCNHKLLNANVYRQHFNRFYRSQIDEAFDSTDDTGATTMKVSSYEKVIENFENAKINKNLKECPSHWGGFSFVPHYFEFWEGNENRVNKRTVYKKEENIWKKYYLQP